MHRLGLSAVGLALLGGVALGATATWPDGAVPGVVNPSKIFWGSVASSTSDGSWSLSLTSLGCSSPPIVTAQAVAATGAAITGQAWATVTTQTASVAGGHVLVPSQISGTLSGNQQTSSFSTGGQVVNVIAVCR